MAGIMYVRMTNPEADCKQVGMGMGRSENIVRVGWKTNAATPFKVLHGICAAHAASQTAIHGPFAVAPTKFQGRLRQISVIYPHTAPRPKPLYDLQFLRGNNATLVGPDIAASALANIPLTEASAKVSQCKTFDPPLDVNWDITLGVTGTGATGTSGRTGIVELCFE